MTCTPGNLGTHLDHETGCLRCRRIVLISPIYFSGLPGHRFLQDRAVFGFLLLPEGP